MRNLFARLFFLIVGTLYFLPLLTAQVQINHKAYLVGQLKTSTVAAIEVSNLTGVEIHYIFKGWITDEDGQELLRVKSELLKHQPGTAYFSEAQPGKSRQLNVDPLERLELVYAQKGWEAYSGKLTLHAELIHPLDTFSIIARTTREIQSKNGVLVDDQGRFMADPYQVRMNVSLRYGEPFSLETLPRFLQLDNQNEYSYCGTFMVEIRQGEEVLYAATLAQECIPVGITKLTADDLEVVINRYAERALDQPMRLQVFQQELQPHGPTNGQGITPAAHANFNDTYRLYTSEVLGLNFEFFDHAELSPTPDAPPTVEFSEQGRVQEVFFETQFRRQQYPSPINYPGGFYITRGDLNGGLGVLVYDWEAMSAKEWTAYFAYQHRIDPSQVRKTQSEELSIWYPSKWDNLREQNITRLPYHTFTIGIKDANRMIFVSTSSIDTARAAALVPSYRQARYLVDPATILQGLNYNGWRFEAQQTEAGELLDITVVAGEDRPGSEKRTQVFERYAGYAAILKEELQNWWEGAPYEPPSQEELDRRIAENPDFAPLALAKMRVLKPGAVDFRKYDYYYWEAAHLRFRHRIQGEGASDANIFPYETVYILDDEGKIRDRRSSQGRHTSQEKAENTILFQSDYLHLPTVSGQYVMVHHAPLGTLSDQEIMILLRDEFKNPFTETPTLRQEQVEDWDFFVSADLTNPGKRAGRFNSMFIRTPEGLYKVTISGGLQSDFKSFFNSLEISGRRLRFEYDTAGHFQRVQFQ